MDIKTAEKIRELIQAEVAAGLADADGYGDVDRTYANRVFAELVEMVKEAKPCA